MRILILAVLLVGCVSAQGYTNYGPGVRPCGQWIAEREDNYQYAGWLQGWVSAAGAYGAAEFLGYNKSGDLAESGTEAMEAWVDKYCRENPLEPIRAAAEALVKELAIRVE